MVSKRIIFQVGGGFNRDYWARFEKFVKDVVKKSDDVYVVTGPVFAPQVTPQGVRSGHAYIGVDLVMAFA
jgi:endonuclease G